MQAGPSGREEIQFVPRGLQGALLSSEVAPNPSATALNGNRHAESPWREDDKDGHYTFELGENLTPRCRFLVASRFLPLSESSTSAHSVLVCAGDS